MPREPWPEKIGKYPVVGELGEGGFGTVFLGRHPKLGTPVAIKVIRSDPRDPEARARFDREARLLADLRHGAIVKVHDYFDWQERQVLVMEKVEGRTLAERLRPPRSREPIEPIRALSLLRQIAEALSVAHEKGIVHRDLKAENVMLSEDEQSVTLLDFGLAKTLGGLETSKGDRDREFKTRWNQWIGTPHAMSPEQIRGQEIDARSDLFSLGALAYHMVTGERPFYDADDQDATRLNVKTNSQAPATTKVETVPVELSKLIDRLLEKDRENRPTTASEVAAELRRLEQAALELSYEPPSDTFSQPTLFGEQPRRKRLLAGGLGLLVAAGFLLWTGFRANLFRSAPPPGIAVLGIVSTNPEEEGSGWLERAATEVLEEGLRIALPHAVEYRAAVDAIQQDLDFHPAEPPSTDRLRALADQSTAGLWLGGSADPVPNGSVHLEMWMLRTSDGAILERWSRNVSEERWLDELVALVGEISEELGQSRLSTEESDRLQRLFPQDPESARLYFAARAASARFEIEQARERLEEGIGTEDHPSYLLALAEIDWRSGDSEAAAARARKAVDQARDLAEIDQLRVEARAYELQARGADREDWLGKASRAYGRLFELSRDEEFAIRQLEIDAELDVPEVGCPPTSFSPEAALSLREQARVFLAQGRACIKLKRYDEAEEPLYRATSNARRLGLDFLEGNAWLSLGRAQDHLKSPTALESLNNARAAYERARSLDGVEASIKRIALLYSRNGEPERARQTMVSYLNYLETEPREFSTAVFFANNSIDFGELAFAQGLLDELLKSRPDLTEREQAEARTVLGVAHYEDGNLREAERFYRSAVTAFEELALPIQKATNLYNLGEIAWQRGDLRGAEELFRRALETEGVDETDPYYAWSFGRLAAGRGDMEAALVHFSTTSEAFEADYSETESAKVMIDRAALELDRRNLSTAPEIAAEARDFLEQNGYELYALRARLVLAEALRRQGNLRAMSSELQAIRSKLDESAQLAIEDLRARAEILGIWRDASVAGGLPVEEATQRLEALAKQATEAGFAWVAYDARLIALELLLATKDAEPAQALARSLRADAEAEGHGRITKRLDVLLPRS